MASIQKNIRTATAGTPPANYGSNSQRNDGLLHQYYRDRSKEFFRQKIPYTSALFAAEIQGVDENDFYAWTPVKLRSSDLINPTTGEHLTDDWQEIILENTNIDSIPVGAYVKFNDSIWIVVNPDDVGSVTGNTIVKRCNCTYNTYDYYGNVVKTPMSYAKGMALASANDITEYITLPGTYQHIVMQLNEATQDVHNNTRLILGGDAYFLTGVTNFIREHTFDPVSHIIRAECRLGEASNYDDLVNEVANGGAFSWEIDIHGASTMPVNGTQTLTATSLRMGSAPEQPYDYLWESSDYSIISVDENGVCEAVGEGVATITCFLQQNTNVYGTIEISTSQSLTGKTVDFVNDVPSGMDAYSTISVEAAIFVNGVRTVGKVGYTLFGANQNTYSATVDGNVLTITSYGYSKTPLCIQAWADDADATGCEEVNGIEIEPHDGEIYEIAFSVDEDTGELSVTSSENLDTQLHFGVSERSGELMVDISDALKGIYLFNIKEDVGEMGVYRVPTSDVQELYLFGY